MGIGCVPRLYPAGASAVSDEGETACDGSLMIRGTVLKSEVAFEDTGFLAPAAAFGLGGGWMLG